MRFLKKWALVLVVNCWFWYIVLKVWASLFFKE